ncbi:TonB-dependent receptor plug domain-containing protein [Thalassotalea euphylliae]|uniref:TonB-dependent receptor plug domain-containing protein n=1 Tax=Thalassotalea euphylliae TaxID=1655234 RepID=UPI003638E9B3
MRALSPLCKAISFAVITPTLFSLPLFSGHAVADETASEEVERIVVTGSRISRADIETASPVTVISSDYIVKAGFQSLEDVLSAQTVVAGTNLGGHSNNGGGGSATVNLRGMGENRTLVLLNGRRMVPSGIGADASVDLNTIPLSMIKSVEILKDGASAVYGSDAIAGVVNIITHKSFDDTELTVDFATTDKGDGETYDISLLHGFDFADGKLAVGLQYSGREDIIQSDRDFVSPACSYYVPGGKVDGLVPDGNGGFEYQDVCYDYTEQSYAQTPNDLYSIFASYNQDLSDDLALNVDAFYTHRDSKQLLAPEPALWYLDTYYIDPEYLAYFEDPEYGVPYYLEYTRRFTDAGNRKVQQKTDTYRISAELKGHLENGDSWDVSVTYAKNEADETMQNGIHAVNMEYSIYANQALWFSGEQLDRDFLISEGVIYTDDGKGGNEQTLITAGYSGETEFGLGYVFGAESRWEEGYYTPDEVSQQGLSTGAIILPTDGDYNVQSAFVETSYPFENGFTLDSALRLDDYSTFGSELTWKLGATYRVNDDLMFRAVRATGFRAPNINELFGGAFGSYVFIYDPWYDEEYEGLVTYTSAEELEPEESDSFTFGIVWDITDNIETTLDYWRFETTNAIGSPDLQGSIDECFAGDTTACEQINITPDGDLTMMESPLINIADQKISGIDWEIQYKGDLFKVSLNSTYMIEFEEEGIDYAGSIDGYYGGYSELRANLDVEADISDDLSALYSIQFIKGMEGEWFGEAFNTASVAYHDMSLSFQASEALRINAGIINLFDKEPEIIPGASDMDTEPSIYDVVGRSFFITSTFTF